MIHVVNERGSNRHNRVHTRILNREVIPGVRKVIGDDILLPAKVTMKPLESSGGVLVTEPESNDGRDIGTVVDVLDPILSDDLPMAGFRNIAAHELGHYHEQSTRMKLGMVILGDAQLHGCWVRNLWSEFYAEHTACRAGWPGPNASVATAPWEQVSWALRDIGGPHGWARTGHYLAYLSMSGAGNVVFEGLYASFPRWGPVEMDALREEAVRLYSAVGLDLSEVSGELVRP